MQREISLLRAIREKDVSKALCLIRNPKTDINWGGNFIEATKSWGDLQVIKAFLERTDIDVNSMNSSCKTAFFYACSHRNIELVRLFLNDSRFDINKPEQICNSTPILEVCSLGHDDIVELLLASSRTIDIKTRLSRNIRNFNSLESALYFGYHYIANVIRDYEVNRDMVRMYLRKKLKMDEEIFAAVLLFSDGHLKILPSYLRTPFFQSQSRYKTERIIKFFTMISKLPLENKMKICKFIYYQTDREFYLSEQTENILRRYVRLYLS